MKLLTYDAAMEPVLLRQMAAFFGFHHSLVEGESAAVDQELRETLADWQRHPSALYVMEEGGAPVGFLRIGYRGPNVAWIEDIFVDEAHRGRGLASRAIGAAEQIVEQIPGYTAVCMDVSPRNADALRLYHRLGYTGLSLITVRKEFSKSKRDKPVELLGHDFVY